MGTPKAMRNLIDVTTGYPTSNVPIPYSTSTPNWTYGTGQVPFWNQVNQWGQKVAQKAGPQVQQFAQGLGQSSTGQQATKFASKFSIPGGGKGLALASGKFAGTALPWLPVAGNVLEGDFKGAAYSALGGALGSPAGPVGIAVGTMLGEPVFGGIEKGVGALIGVGDPSDPLSGREGLKIFGKPWSQIEKTKQRMERSNKLRKEYIMPMMEEIQNNQHKRTMEMASLGMMQNMMSSTNQMMAQLYR